MRKFFLLSTKILVSAILLFLTLQKVRFGDLISRLDKHSVSWLGLAALIALFQILLSALRWWQISAQSGAPLTGAQSLRFNMIGSFFNQTLPSSIGGDAVRIWLVRQLGNGWRRAGYSVFVDRTVGLITLAVIVIATLPWSFQLINNVQGRYALLFVDFAALGGGVVFLTLGRLRWAWLAESWQTKDLFASSRIATRVLFGSLGGASIVAISLLIHFLSVLLVWTVACSIDASASLIQLCELIPPVILITMIPVSIAGWGVREATMGLAFLYAGLPAAEGVNISLLFGAVSFFVGLLGGMVWIISPEKTNRNAPQQPHTKHHTPPSPAEIDQSDARQTLAT